MGQVAIILNGRTYQIACDDGQEDHVRTLAAMVDRRIQELAGTVGQVGDLRLLVMASLLIADEVLELEEQIDETKRLPGGSATEAQTAALADMMESLATRIAAIADGRSDA